MVLLEDVVVVFPRKKAGCFPCKAREAGNAEAEEGKRERSNGRKPEAGSHFPGRMTESIVESKARKASRPGRKCTGE